jgi:hypothetical protein
MCTKFSRNMRTTLTLRKIGNEVSVVEEKA